MRVLGISAYHQDSAAALVIDGRPVAAAQEGLFTKTPLDASLPLRAARSCLSRAGLNGPDLDRVVFYEKPLRRFERTLATALRAFPGGGRGFAREASRWLGDRLWLKGRLADELGVDPKKIQFVEHLASHAACAFYLSPIQRAAVLVADDVGEWATTAIFKAGGTGLELVGEAHLPHSLGLVVSAFVQFLGFDPGKDDEYLGDLAGHGTPRFADAVRELVGADEDASPAIARGHFNFGEGVRQLWTEEMARRFGPARVPGSPLRLGGDDARDADLAASLQQVLEERIVALAQKALERTGEEDLCFAGVLARNRGVNTALLERSGARSLFVPPEPADAGGALGAALYVHHAEASAERNGAPAALFLGETPGSVSEEEPAASGQKPEALLPALLEGRPVGWVRGSLEFAPESLFHRCVLIDPRAESARENLLGALQRTEPFLACRAAVPAERLGEFVELPAGGAGLARLAQLQLPVHEALRAAAPAAVLPDGTARIQAVSRDEDPELHKLLELFGAERGAPVLLLETLRLRGAVVPRSDHEAIDAFGRSQLAALLVDDRLFSAPESAA